MASQGRPVYAEETDRRIIHVGPSTDSSRMLEHVSKQAQAKTSPQTDYNRSSYPEVDTKHIHVQGALAPIIVLANVSMAWPRIRGFITAVRGPQTYNVHACTYCQ